MLNHVVRLSGSQAGNTPSIENLVSSLKRYNGRVFIVVSAYRQILDAVYGALEHVLDADTDRFSRDLQELYKSVLQVEASPSYVHLVEQVKALLTGIKLIGDYSASLKDQLAGFSEKLTVEIYKNRFEKDGLKCTILWPEDIGLVATNDYGNATFLSVNLQKLEALVDGFYLIPGSYGVTEQGKISRAGKSAADYTAAFLTRELGASRLELWGIDQAFMRADTRIVPQAPGIARLTYSEASELAYFDHYSFHPRTVEPLEEVHIPVVILNTGSVTGEVETIINTETFVEEQIVKSIACSDDISLLRLNGPGVGLKPGILAKVTARLNQSGINIRSVITSQISINLILERSTGPRALALIRQLGFSSVKEISLIDDVALIGVVGHGMQQNYGVSAKIFGAVAQHKVNVVLSGSGASDLVSYLVVRSTDKEKSVREIYNAFF